LSKNEKKIPQTAQLLSFKLAWKMKIVAYFIHSFSNYNALDRVPVQTWLLIRDNNTTE
jgi:hypothetical protein